MSELCWCGKRPVARPGVDLCAPCIAATTGDPDDLADADAVLDAEEAASHTIPGEVVVMHLDAEGGPVPMLVEGDHAFPAGGPT